MSSRTARRPRQLRHAGAIDEPRRSRRPPGLAAGTNYSVQESHVEGPQPEATDSRAGGVHILKPTCSATND